MPIVAGVDRRERRLEGMRIAVWRQHESTDGEPVIVLSASSVQLALARLHAGVGEVEAALEQAERARK